MAQIFSIPDFEKPIVELENQIAELLRMNSRNGINLSNEINSLQGKCTKLKKEIFEKLTCWQRVQLARHPLRPYTLDYMNLLFDSFTEFYGDRKFADDAALVGGLAKFNSETVVIIGHQKGRSTQENLQRNFGMVQPEGYRKALRLMRFAEKFGFPVISFIDTPGAYPGIGAEERGQAEAIATNLKAMSVLKVPIIVLVIGEGGSGGALAIGMGDLILMLENAIYSVISPEGCASILWRNSDKASEAARALCLTAQELLRLGVIDKIIPEPLGGAHRDTKTTANSIKQELSLSLKALKRVSLNRLLSDRYNKFRKMGKVLDRSRKVK